MSNGKDTLPDWQLYCLMILMLIFGTANTLVMKYQDEYKIDDPALSGSTGKFVHPYFQCANMFLGEFCCLIVYFGKQFWRQHKNKKLKQLPMEDETPLSPGTQLAVDTKLKTKINPFWFAIPAAFDCTASSLMFVGLTQCAASVYQMMRGAIVLITAFFSVIFLKRKQYSHHLVSLFIIVSGVALVGWSSIAASEKQKKDSGDESDDSGSTTTIFGVLVLILAQCFTGGQFITEEKLFDGYYLDPLFVVGCEGMFGTIYFLILLPIFQQIKCTTDGICSDAGYVENTTLAFKQLGAYPALLWMSIGIIFSISCFNATGVSITKYASAAQRSTVDTCRTLFIWIISLATGQEYFNWGELFAFFLLVFGTMVYNEIIIVPIDFMRKNTAQYRLAREGKQSVRASMTGGRDPQDGQYIATSPTAGYDQGRNVRNIEKKLAERESLVAKHQEMMMQGDNDDFIANASDENKVSSKYSSQP